MFVFIHFIKFDIFYVNLLENFIVFDQFGFIFFEIVKLIQVYQKKYMSLLKFPIQKMRRKFFEKLSQNPSYVKNHCNDMENQ